MNRLPLKAYLGLVYVLLLLSLLLFLAVLQYRWTGEISLTEQQRMKAFLNENLSFMERSFDREISRAALSFWHNPQALPAPISAEWRARFGRVLAEDWARWNVSTRDPKLVQRLLVAEIQNDHQLLLWQANPLQQSWQQVQWPGELAEFRNLMGRYASNTISEEDLRRWSPQERRFLSPFCLIAEIPAFVSPVAVEPIRAASGGANLEVTQGGWGKVRSCLIVYLDRDYLVKEYLPSLVAQHLSTDGVIQYEYLVQTLRPPRQVLFAEPPNYQDALVSAPDATVSLLQLRLEEYPDQEKVRQLVDTLRRPARQAPEGSGTPDPSIDRARTVPSLGARASIPGGGSVEPMRIGSEAELQRERREPEGTRTRPTEPLRRLMELEAANGWQLLVRHRAGSLQAAVTLARQRNLFVSFGILLVLAASLVAFAVAVRRARGTARQQMEFVASISHELRTPVTAICSLSENLADGLVRPEEQVRRYGQFILREGRRLGGLIEHALEFAGMTSGRRRHRMQCVAVAPILRTALQSCEAQLQEADAKVETQIEPGLPPIVADSESLVCAIQNLISNAIKYSPGGAVITVRASHSRDDGQVRIAVVDKGMGISQDEIKQIFEPFFRGRKALDLQIRGAGIGLSLVKRIAIAHNGRVHVSSRPGEGTRVTLSIPAANRGAPEDDQTQSKPTASNAGDCHAEDSGDRG